MENYGKYMENYEKCMENYGKCREIMRNYGKCMENHCLGILYKNLVYYRKLHVFTGFTFIVLFGIVELCIINM